MNGKKMSGEITGREMSGKKTTIGTNTDNANGKMTAANMTSNGMSGKKKFPIGWLLSVAALGLFIGHFWSYIPGFRGIVSLFVFSKFLAGLSGTHLLL